MIDTQILDPSEPIDMTVICNSNYYKMEPKLNHFGVNLTDEGMNEFKAKVNIEVQYAKEPVIAAIERNGGVITTAFYDMESVIAAYKPIEFFLKGLLEINAIGDRLLKCSIARPTDTQEVTAD